MIVLENSRIKATVLPDCGGKISSLLAKEGGGEVLFTKEPPGLPDPYREFGPYAYGIDDCFPSIDPCVVEGKEIPDHGSLWSVPWTVVHRSPTSLVLTVFDRITELDIEKEFTLIDDILRIRFTVRNSTRAGKSFIRTFHGLFLWEPDMELIFPKETVWTRVHGDCAPSRLEKLSTYPEGSSFKWWAEPGFPQGETGILYPSRNLKILFSGDPLSMGNMALWVTTGGYQGEKNVAPEPSAGYGDRLDIGIEEGTAIKIGSGERMDFTLELQLLTRRAYG